MEQEPNEQEPNEATEIVGGKVETVEVSRHPEASIPETDLSLADIERRRSHPLRWALIFLPYCAPSSRRTGSAVRWR